jgi:hypothetical protein
LIAFSTNSDINDNCLEPFSKYYPSLLSIEYCDYETEIHQSLLTALENNPQLTSLKLSLKSWSSEILDYINSNLINLEELKLHDYGNNDIDFIPIFCRPTKIKKLDLEWTRLSNLSLNSILINCPQLEELILNQLHIATEVNYVKTFNLINPIKLKKLSIGRDAPIENEFESYLLNFPHLNELSITLLRDWEIKLKNFYESSCNIERLSIKLLDDSFYNILYSSCERFYETEFFTKNHKRKSALKYLTLDHFEVTDSKASYFNNFENLKSINFTSQLYVNYCRSDMSTKVNMDLWPGYKQIIKYNMYNFDIELKKVLN